MHVKCNIRHMQPTIRTGDAAQFSNYVRCHNARLCMYMGHALFAPWRKTETLPVVAALLAKLFNGVSKCYTVPCGCENIPTVGLVLCRCIERAQYCKY